MGIFKILGSLFGIGGEWLKNKQETNRLKQVQEHEIIRAETEAVVNRIKSNTESDNEIDLITARNKRYTLKDEVVTYLFLIPVITAASVPFIQLFYGGNPLSLNEMVRDSYTSLDNLPEWYKYILGAIIVDVLGFRSFMRKFIESRKIFNKK
ncbi:hypothetical protein [Tenacibaculum phage Larrie]|nr:hypothetical protein [Tenacibaculum phage Larrie]